MENTEIREATLALKNQNRDKCDSRKKTKSFNTYKNLILISLSYLLIFTGFSGLQNLQSSIYTDPSVGFTYLCVLYSAFTSGSIFLPNVFITKIGYKYSLVVGLSGYVTFTLAHLYPKFWLMVFVSLITGFASAINWAAAGCYITAIANEHALYVSSSLASVSPKFFSIFYIGFRSSQVAGNLISSLVLQRKSSFTNSTLVNQCGARFCPSEVVFSITGQANSSTVTTLTWIYLAFGGMAVLLALCLTNITKTTSVDTRKATTKGELELQKETTEEKVVLNKATTEGGQAARRQQSLKTKLFACFVLCKDIRILLLLPITLFAGLEATFVYGDFTKAFVTCSISIENVGFVMMCFGASCCMVSLLISIFVRKIGSFPIAAMGAILLLCLLLWSLLWNVNKTPSWLLYVTVALWGAADIMMVSQIHACYGVLFLNQQEEAFGMFKTIQSCGFVIFLALGNHMCIRTKLVILLVFLVLGSILYTHLYLKYQRIETKETVDNVKESGVLIELEIDKEL